VTRSEDDVVGSSVGRVLAFSDGVFAIAITILVLNLEVPEGLSLPELTAALRDLRPELFSAALSFVVIGRFWVSHHDVLDHVVVADRRLLALNTVVLGPLVLVPFVTQLLADYGEVALVVACYSATVAGLALALLALWLCAVRPPRTDGTVDRDEVLSRALGIGTSAAAFLIAIPVAVLSPRGAMLCWLLGLVPTQLLVRRRMPSGGGQRQQTS
jgi:uncharacterized membrane protein